MSDDPDNPAAEAAGLKLALASIELKYAAAELGLRPDAVPFVAERIVNSLRLGSEGALESHIGETIKSIVADLRAIGDIPFAFVQPPTHNLSLCAFTREQLRAMGPRERLSVINGENARSPLRKAPR